MAGLFFCLASAEGAGLLFCPAAIQPHTSVYSAFCVVHAIYTAHLTKPRAGLYNGILCDLTHLTAHDTRPMQSAIIIPPAPRQTLYRSAYPPIIIMYNKGAPVQRCALVIDPYQAVQQTANHASPAMCRYFPRLAAGVLVWVSLALCFFLARRRGTIDGLPPRLFSGFRPIANRGQQ